jgi:hypothetical protein
VVLDAHPLKEAMGLVEFPPLFLLIEGEVEAGDAQLISYLHAAASSMRHRPSEVMAEMAGCLSVDWHPCGWVKCEELGLGGGGELE